MPKNKGKDLSEFLKQHKRKPKPKKKIKKNQRILRITQLTKKLKEEKDVSNFLKQAVKLKDDEDLLLATKTFTKTSSDTYNRQARISFFFGPSGVITLLPPNEYRKFVNYFLGQPSKRVVRSKDKSGEIVEKTIDVTPLGLNEFWDEYREQLTIRKIIQVRAKELENAEEEQKRVREILEDMEVDEKVDEKVEDEVDEKVEDDVDEKVEDEVDEKVEDEVDDEVDDEEEKPRTTIMVEMILDKDGKPIKGDDGRPILMPVDKPSRPRRPKTDKGYTKCMREMRSAPWIEGNVRGCYVLPLKKSLVDEYALRTEYRNVTLTINGHSEDKVMYRANRNLYELLCNAQSDRNTQRGEVIQAYTSDGKIIQLYIAYEVEQPYMGTNMMVQNEEMAAKKATWLARAREGRAERMKRLLGGPISTLLKNIGTQSFFNASENISQNFAKSASEIIVTETETASKYIERVASTLAYFQDPAATVFRERVREGWYNPITFVSLTPQQMLPHSTMSGDTPLAIANARAILARQRNIISRLGNRYYSLTHPTEREPTRPINIGVAPTVEVNEWRFHCKNKDDIVGIPDHRLVTYIDDDKVVYCLDVKNLISQIHTHMSTFGEDLSTTINLSLIHV